jgi:hypothetical protein
MSQYFSKRTAPCGIEGEWVDVPRGTNMNAGTMLLHISSPTIMYKISQTGGFGPDTWRKVG